MVDIIGKFIILFINAIIAIWIISIFGPILYELAEGVPFGAIFQIILPSPEGVLIDTIKILFDTIVLCTPSFYKLVKE